MRFTPMIVNAGVDALNSKLWDVNKPMGAFSYSLSRSIVGNILALTTTAIFYNSIEDLICEKNPLLGIICDKGNYIALSLLHSSLVIFGSVLAGKYVANKLGYEVTYKNVAQLMVAKAATLCVITVFSIGAALFTAGK